MTVWRIHCKTGSVLDGRKSDKELLDFFRRENIVGIGYWLVKSRDEKVWKELEQYPEKYLRGGRIAINAIMNVKTGDFVWFREGNNYYLFKVGDRLWKNSIPKECYEEYDVGQFVSGNWVQVSEAIPDEIIRSFYRGSIRRIRTIPANITAEIWERSNR